MKTIVIIFALAFSVWQILLKFGVFDFQPRPRKTVSELDARRKKDRLRKFHSFYLGVFAESVNMFRGLFMSPYTREQHTYYIERLEIRDNVLDRALTPEELRGRYVLPLLVSLIFIPVALFWQAVIVAPLVAFILFATYQMQLKLEIQDEDEIIDNYFIDLYLLLYSKLRQGSRARLQGTVENYIDTLEATKASLESKVMTKFARYLLNLLALYEDHVAVPKLRDIYHSATIINFCNVASQALNGIENADNLLTFKMMLVERRTEQMRERQAKILRAGNRSIYLIWIILFIFIAVGWYSKLPTGFF